MLVSFEQAKYQSLSTEEPTSNQTTEEPEAPVGLGDLVRRLREVDSEAKAVTKFDNFISKIQQAAKKDASEDPDVESVQRGDLVYIPSNIMIIGEGLGTNTEIPTDGLTSPSLRLGLWWNQTITMKTYTTKFMSRVKIGL